MYNYPMDKFKLYLFDFDGTILYTLPSLIDIFVKSYAAIGLTAKPEDALRYSRIPLEESFNELGGDPAQIPVFSKALYSYIDDIEIMKKTQLFEDTLEFLKYLKKHRIKAGVVTSNTSKHVRDVFEMFKLPNPFSVIVGNEETKGKKPNPEPLYKALELFHYVGDLQEVVYVGDALNDGLCAKNAHVHPIIIDRNHEYDDINKYEKIYSLLDLFK